MTIVIDPGIVSSWPWLAAPLIAIGVLMRLEWIVKKLSFFWGKIKGLFSHFENKRLTKIAYDDMEASKRPFLLAEAALSRTEKFLRETSEDKMNLESFLFDKDKSFSIAMSEGRRAIRDLYPNSWNPEADNEFSVDQASARKIIHALEIARTYWKNKGAESEVLVAKDLLAKYEYQSRKKKRRLWFG